MIALALTLHLLAAVIWIGGMFFSYTALRPAAMALEPPLRLRLWSDTLARFFPWVWSAITLLLITGYWMVFGMGGFSAVGPHVHLMHGIAWIMAAIFAYVYFAPYRRMRGQVQAEDFAAAGAEMLRIRPLVGVNLGLGLLMVVVASGGKFWL